MLKNKAIDFLGIGAPRSGTTWLGECLAAHPDILFSSQKSRKEINYFNKDEFYSKGWQWYLSQFPEEKRGKMRGEFSPLYLRSERAFKRIKKDLPRVKLIVSLRQPAEMVYSLYSYQNASLKRRTIFSFRELVEEGDFKNGLLKAGFYHRYLKRYYTAFGSDQIHLIIFDDIKKRPRKVLRELYKFLGVESSFIPEQLIGKKINPGRKSRFLGLRKFGQKWIDLSTQFPANFLGKSIKKVIDNPFSFKIYQKINLKENSARLNSDLKTKLTSIYLTDIKKLEKLTGQSFSCWYESIKI